MGQRERIIEIARNEIGYKEQGNNITKYGEWYGMQDAWCDMFIAWCANQAGVSENIIPKHAYVPSTANWFSERNQYKNSKHWGGNYIPKPGDIVLFDWDQTSISDHIGFVEKVEGNTLYTIEGNSNNMVARRTYSLDSKDLRAFCVPAYEDGQEETIPSKEEEEEMKVYQNGTTKEPIFADTQLTKQVGYLNPHESCECYGIYQGRAVVRYEVDRTKEEIEKGVPVNYKVGFAEWLGGVQ